MVIQAKGIPNKPRKLEDGRKALHGPHPVFPRTLTIAGFVLLPPNVTSVLRYFAPTRIVHGFFQQLQAAVGRGGYRI